MAWHLVVEISLLFADPDPDLRCHSLPTLHKHATSRSQYERLQISKILTVESCSKVATACGISVASAWSNPEKVLLSMRISQKANKADNASGMNFIDITILRGPHPLRHLVEASAILSFGPHLYATHQDLRSIFHE